MLDFAVTHEPRATFRAAPGTAQSAAGHPDRPRRHLPRRLVDGHRLARDDGERRPKRPRRGARRPGRPSRRWSDRRRALRSEERRDDDRRGPLGRRRPGDAHARHPAPALAAARAGLVEGRARDERDDRRRGPLPAPFPRHPRAGGRLEQTRGLDPEPPAARRVVGDLLRRARATSRPRSRPTSRSADRRRSGRRRAHARARPRSCASAGGAEASRVFTRMWLALLGLWSWDAVPTLPPEQILLPPRAPLSVYSFGCWARQTIVALSIVTALQPSSPRSPSRSTSSASGSRRRPPERPLGPAVRRARPRPATCTAAGPSGRPAGARCAPPSAGSSTVRRETAVGRDPAALGLVDHRAARARLPARPSGRSSGRSRGSTTSRSSTTRAGGSRRASRRSGTRRSRWSRCSTRASPAEDPAIVQRLRLARGAGGAARAATGRCAGGTSRRAASPSSSRTRTTPTSTTPRWSCSRCSRAGRDPTGAADRGPRLDARDAEQVGRLRRLRRRQHEPALRQARLLRLRRGHRPAERGRDRARARGARPRRASRASGPARARSTGSCASRSETARGSAAGARNYVYGTGAVLPALAACGLGEHESVRRGVALARSACRTRTEASARISAPTATAAGAAGASRRPRRPPGRCSGSHAGGASGGEAASRAMRWLVETQQADGGWDEPYFTGTGFPGDFYLNYHLYRDVFPVMALGRILNEGRGMSERLLILAPLRIEQLALGTPAGLSGAPHGNGAGTGPDRGGARARKRARSRSRSPDCARASTPALRPGDVLCATELVDEAGGAHPGARKRPARQRPPPAGPARPRRARSSRSRESSARRSAAGSRGVLAVDMESAWLAAGAGGRPFAVARVVADEAGRHLADPQDRAGRDPRAAKPAHASARRSPNGPRPRRPAYRAPRRAAVLLRRRRTGDRDRRARARAARSAGLRAQADRSQRARRRRPRAAWRGLRRGARRGARGRDGRLLGSRRLAGRQAQCRARARST